MTFEVGRDGFALDQEHLRHLVNTNNLAISENLPLQVIFSSDLVSFLKSRYVRLVLGLVSLYYSRGHTSDDCS